MPKVIAMAGKGGTGKTTISALLINYMLHKGLTPVLAVDADANANLNELLGMEVCLTLGEIRRDLKGDIPAHITRDQFMEMKVHEALIEETGFDLLVMGQPDGPGCYCAANQQALGLSPFLSAPCIDESPQQPQADKHAVPQKDSHMD